jgi:hypothetical protein
VTNGAGASRQVGDQLLLVEPEDPVARPDAAVDLDGNLLPGTHLFDRLVLDLHGSDHLPEIGGAAENVKDVAQTDRVGEVEDGDADPAIVMGYMTNELARHGCLLLVLAES